MVGLFADPNIIVYFGAGSAANVSYAGLFYGNPRQPPGRHHDRGIRRADIPKPEPASSSMCAFSPTRVQGLGAGCRSGWDQTTGRPCSAVQSPRQSRRSRRWPDSRLKRRGDAGGGFGNGVPGPVVSWEVEDVAKPTDCPNVSRPVRVILDLCPEPADVYLQVIPGVRPIWTPCVVQQLTPADDPTGVVHQLPQNDELLVRQVNRCASDEEPVPVELQLHVTDSQDPQPTESLGIDRQVAARVRMFVGPPPLDR